MIEKYLRYTFDDIELINNEDDYNNCLDDMTFVKEVFINEIKYLAQQGINILKVDYNHLYIVVKTKIDSFNNFYSNNIAQCDEKGNVINGYKEVTNNAIKNKKAKMISDYLKKQDVKFIKYIPEKNIVSFACHFCNKTELTSWVTLGKFEVKTFNNNSCNNDKHIKKWETWTKDLIELWKKNEEKNKLIFSMNEKLIIETIEKAFPPIIRSGSFLYYYNDCNFYSLIEENTENSDLDRFIYDSFIKDNECILNVKEKNDIKNYLKSGFRGWKYKQFQDEKLINFRNGVLNIETMELLKHSPDYFFTYILPCDYNPELINGKLEAIVSDWGLNLQDIKKMLAYCFQSKNYLEKSFYLIGKPNCGKGTLASMIKYMFTQKCESITIKDLYETHGTSTIKDKTCLIDEDFDNKTFLSCDVKRFNKLISGESYNLNVKYKSIQNLNSTMKFIICANDYPRFKSENDNGGFRRRIFYMQFTSQYKQGINQDTSIKQQFQSDIEMQSEFMNWVIEGLQLLNNRNPKEAFFDNQDELNERIVKNAEPIIEYLLENLEVTDNHKLDRITSKDIVTHYKNWCIENMIDNPVGIKTFNKKLSEVLNIDEQNIGKQFKLDGKNVKGITGVRFKNGNPFKVYKGEL